jgi:uncharacterized protein (TIRG00374 family)
MRKLGIRAFLTIALVAVLLSTVNLAHVYEILISAERSWLLAAVAISALSTVTGAIRWHFILAGAGLPVPLLRTLQVSLGSSFFSLFTPSAIGGDVMKVVLLGLDAPQRDKAISTVLLDRVIGLLITVVVGVGAVALLPSTWHSSAILTSLVLAALACVAGVVTLLSRRLLDIASRCMPSVLWQRIGPTALGVNTSLRSFLRRPAVLLCAAAISLVRQLLMCLSAYYAGLAFGIQIGPVAYFAVIPITLAVITLPISINGIGLQDNALVLLLGVVGVATPYALTLSLFMHVLNNGTALFGGLILLLTYRRSKKTPPHGFTSNASSSTPYHT